eukprot:TRINITY_DN47033_c0_g1_i9.p1 TRINITY_DN47033_c0_g1~~TRINITY_DN47033_c0_g1_i9.p1  ORF type:complete len:167 (-),score=51.11 TRINITY_DN47033_c0_g1_i9:528-1028(-)
MLRLAAAEAPTEEAPSEVFGRLFNGDARPVVLYDGVCNMCNKAVDVAMESDPAGERLRFGALQSTVGRALLVNCGRAAEDISSMVVVLADGTCLVGSDAPLFVGKQLEGNKGLQMASQAASMLVPKAVSELAYKTLAANRYSVLGKREELRTTDAKKPDRFVSDLP